MLAGALLDSHLVKMRKLLGARWELVPIVSNCLGLVKVRPTLQTWRRSSWAPLPIVIEVIQVESDEVDIFGMTSLRRTGHLGSLDDHGTSSLMLWSGPTASEARGEPSSESASI